MNARQQGRGVMPRPPFCRAQKLLQFLQAVSARTPHSRP
jgi:hypothetical protein